jgi:hypothetical protein
MNAIDEPLQQSALLAWQIAPGTCCTDPASGTSCAWYHGLWQYLRILKINSTPEHTAAFFDEAFGNVARAIKRPRILVSGAADYSTFAQALSVCRRYGAEPEFTVLDMCETPLVLNRWYAERLGVAIQTLRADILEYKNSSAFDIVCSHAFFGRFAPSRWDDLAASWAALLTKNGVAITVNRIRGAARTETVGFKAEQAQALRAEVLRRAQESSIELGVAPVVLADMAERYASNHHVYPVHSELNLRNVFEAAGLTMDHLSLRGSAKTGPAQLGGPTTLEGATYACLIARKP